MLTLFTKNDDFNLYSVLPMSTPEQDPSTELSALETKLETLINQFNLIKSENKSLKVRQDALVKEKAKLLEKTTLAKARVEAMIVRLKAMEQDS